MKRKLILVWMACFCGLSLQAQAQELSLETTAGNLHNLLTEEQQASVVNLTLTGSMDNSDFYFIRDNMARIKMLNVKEVEADTIPAGVFSRGISIVRTVYLPRGIQYIGEKAFWGQHIEISGGFPELASQAFGVLELEVHVAEDNDRLSQYENAIYSSDGKILYYFGDYGYKNYENYIWTVREGTEVIAGRAFDNCAAFQITFPSSLKSIEEHAFENTRMFRKGFDPQHYKLRFNSTVPPELAKDVFRENEVLSDFELEVPTGSFELYQQADEQWSVFKANQSITLETTAGNLHNLLTERDQMNITTLTLTGSMDDSDFYFIRDKMTRLALLDLEKIDIDTIPGKAFYRYGCKEIRLPAQPLYVKTSAFESTGIGSFIITGPFPELRTDVFGDENTHRATFLTSGNNKYCKTDLGGNIISVDGLTFYWDDKSDPFKIIPDRVETIESYAFDGTTIVELEFPSSLKLIKAYAFTNFKTDYYACIPPKGSYFLSKAEKPPVLEEHAFEDQEDISNFILVVPCDPRTYMDADAQWLLFDGIRFGYTGIESERYDQVTVSKEDGGYAIRSESEMIRLDIFGMAGNKCYGRDVRDTSLRISLDSLPKGIMIGRVYLSDGSVACIKIMNQ